MSELQNLKKEAREATDYRGHAMSKWDNLDRWTAVSYCTKCGKQVAVDTNPPPNGIDICGEAVALNCR